MGQNFCKYFLTKLKYLLNKKKDISISENFLVDANDSGAKKKNNYYRC